jgi:putative spermidine/putrescine transport system permease protein
MVAVVPTTAPTSTPRRRRSRIGRTIVFTVAGLYFLAPVAAAFWFSVDNGKTGFTLHAYTSVFDAPGFATAFGTSLKLAIITVVLTLVLMVPTMLMVHLRHPRLRSMIEVLCLLPLVIPPVVLVVGVRTVLGWGPDQLAGTPLQGFFNGLQNSSPPWILALEYVILALPFTYRALDAGLRSSGVTTLVEAARNLGSSWPTVIMRVVLPTLRTSVLNAAFLAFALVLGEFTIANILLYQTFTVWILQFNDTDGQLSVGLSLLSLFITWLLLLLIALAGGGRTRKEATS